MIKRHLKILEIINEYEKIEVIKLAELIGVSQVTTRKDLDMLVEQGLIKREHGFATIGNSEDLNTRMALHYRIKKKIAEKAAHIVKDGETVMIESGSCCALLADELARSKKNITIVTNSMFIASRLRATDANVILLGGEIQKSSEVMIGAMTRMCANAFCVDKLFVGVDGFSEKSGFTSGDLMRADTVKGMAEAANHVIVLTDSSKFEQRGLVSVFAKDEVDCVYTDTGISVHTKEFLEKSDIQVSII